MEEEMYRRAFSPSKKKLSFIRSKPGLQEFIDAFKSVLCMFRVGDLIELKKWLLQMSQDSYRQLSNA